jgi:hypothetical protein
VGGTLEPEHYVDVGRNDRVDGYLALGPGYSRRREIVPLLERVGMQSPWRLIEMVQLEGTVKCQSSLAISTLSTLTVVECACR